MISDILSDAISEVESYLTDMPEVYEEHKNEIADLLKRMEALRQKLDAPLAA